MKVEDYLAWGFAIPLVVLVWGLVICFVGYGFLLVWACWVGRRDSGAGEETSLRRAAQSRERRRAMHRRNIEIARRERRP